MEKAQDVEMKDVSDDSKVTKEGDKEKPQEKEKDADTLTVEGRSVCAKIISYSCCSGVERLHETIHEVVSNRPDKQNHFCIIFILDE